LKKELWFHLDDQDEAAKKAWEAARTLDLLVGSELRKWSADYSTLFDPMHRDPELPGSGEVSSADELPSTNVIQAMVMRQVSDLTRNKVLPWFITQDGDTSLRQKSKGMTLAVQGVLESNGMYGEDAKQVCLRGCVFDEACVHWRPDLANNRVTKRIVPHWALTSPPSETRHGAPRQFFLSILVSRDELLGDYADDPEAKELINNAQAASNSTGGDFNLDGISFDSEHADMVRVCYAWHIPSTRVDTQKAESWGFARDDGKSRRLSREEVGHDGRYMVMVGESEEVGGVLTDVPWPFDFIPVARFRAARRVSGDRGRGIPETLLAVQAGITELDKRLDEAIRVHGSSFIYVDRNAKVNTDHITNDTADIVEGNGPNGVQVNTPNPISPQVFQRQGELINWSFQQLGRSELSATGAKPAGVESGVALQTLLDNDQGRQSDAFSGWENFFLDCGKSIVACLRWLDRMNGNVKVKAIGGNSKSLELVDWAKVDMAEDKYHLKLWSSNYFSQSPAVNLERANFLYKLGAIDRDMLLDSIGAPDVQSMIGDTTALGDNIDRKIDEAITQGKPITVHPFFNLSMMKRRLVLALNRLDADGMLDSAEARILITAYEDTEVEVSKQNQQQQQPPPGGGPGPAVQATEAAPASPQQQAANPQLVAVQ